MQKGHIFQRHGAWHLRYRLNGKQVCQKLADSNDYRTLKSVRPLAEEVLCQVNQGRQAEPQTLQQFIESVYFQHVEQHRRASTIKGYQNLYNQLIARRIAGVRIAAFRTKDGQMLLNRIATEHDLSHSTLIHVKSFLSGVFTFAKRMGNLDGNPMEGVEVPRGRQTKPTQAYSKEEIAKMIEVLTGVSRTAVILAAYTGMSLAELKGLKWQDVAENELTINQTVWRRTESPPKTQAWHGSIPLLPIVKGVLAEHRKLNPSTVWVFESMYVRPMDLAGLGGNHIKKTLKGAGVNWLGWHALRRGFATRLHEEGVQDRIIQSLLRHSSLSVTMKHYVKATPKANIEAMQKLE